MKPDIPSSHIKRIPSCPKYGATITGEIVRLIPDRTPLQALRIIKPTPNMSHSARERLGPNCTYYRVRIPNHSGTQRLIMVHRLVCEAFHGPPPSKFHQGAHLNGIRSDNRPENLAWKTPLENAADTIRHGTRIRGENHPSAKLNEPIVLSLRDKRAAGTLDTIKEAQRHRCSQKSISDAARGKTWTWLHPDQDKPRKQRGKS